MRWAQELELTQAKSNLSPVCVSQVLLGHSLILCLHAVYSRFPTTKAELSKTAGTWHESDQAHQTTTGYRVSHCHTRNREGAGFT